MVNIIPSQKQRIMKNHKKSVKELLALEDNLRCFDCDTPNPQWASVTFGTFICLECAGTHRSYGASISRVKSVNMDDWSEKEYLKMKMGGNGEFSKFVLSHNLNKKEDMFYKKSLAISYAKKLEESVSEVLKEDKSSGPINEGSGGHTRNEQSTQIRPQHSHVERRRFYENRGKSDKATSSSESSLNQALNTTISVVGRSVATGARLIKDKTVEYGGKISESIVKPSIKLLKEKRKSLSSSSRSESDLVEVRPKSSVKEDTTWCQWD